MLQASPALLGLRASLPSVRDWPARAKAQSNLHSVASWRPVTGVEWLPLGQGQALGHRRLSRRGCRGRAEDSVVMALVQARPSPWAAGESSASGLGAGSPSLSYPVQDQPGSSCTRPRPHSARLTRRTQSGQHLLVLPPDPSSPLPPASCLPVASPRNPCAHPPHSVHTRPHPSPLHSITPGDRPSCPRAPVWVGAGLTGLLAISFRRVPLERCVLPAAPSPTAHEGGGSVTGSSAAGSLLLSAHHAELPQSL